MIAGIHKTLEDDQFKYSMPVKILRRFNTRLEEIKDITEDNEFINFSVSIRGGWADDQIVDNREFKFRINEFFGYTNHAYNIKIERSLPKLVLLRLKSLFLDNLRRIIMGIIVAVIGGLILAWIL